MTDKITIERETLQAALDALEYMHNEKVDYMVRNKLGNPSNETATKLAVSAIAALRAALAAQPAKQVYEHDSMHSQNIPFGRMAREAADEIERLQQGLQQRTVLSNGMVEQMTKMAEHIRVLREACEAVDDLIAYQYTGSREAMTMLQLVSDQCRAALKIAGEKP